MRVRGKIKWFDNTKGYGFISLENSPDVFVHYTAILGEGFKALRDNDAVEFDMAPSRGDRPQAANVVKLREDKPLPPTIDLGFPPQRTDSGPQHRS